LLVVFPAPGILPVSGFGYKGRCHGGGAVRRPVPHCVAASVFFVMCHSDTIQSEHLPASITQKSAAVTGVSPGKRNEREIIAEALRRNRGNRARTAKELSMHRTTLWRKAKLYGLDD